MTIKTGITTSAEVVEQELTWEIAEEILTHISDPVFTEYKVNINDFGAIPNDDKLDTEAINEAIKHVSLNGGGMVIVPKGIYDTGSIQLLSNVNLCLEDEESILRFTIEINEENYPVAYSHWETSPGYNYRALIYAYEAENIALTGKGKLDGQASKETWWNWKHQIEHAWSEDKVSLQEKASNQLRAMNNDDARVEERIFGEGGYLRPNFIQTILCKNVLFEGVTLNNSPMWQVNPVRCENVIIRGMTLQSHGDNNDGCDTEICNYVLIEDNVFDSGDDCIAIKSGRDRDGRELNEPSQNIIIRNNVFADGHGGIAMGSERSGGIKNVFAENNHFDSPNLTYPLRLKTNAKRGGIIENVYLKDSIIDNVNQATIYGTMVYADGRNGDYLPQFKNIVIKNVKSKGGDYGIFLEAFEEIPITGLVFRNVEISDVGNPLRAMNWGKDVIMENVTINGEVYPKPTEVRILGVPSVGNKLTAAGLLIGGDPSTMKYTWFMADNIDGTYEEIASGIEYTVPANTAGKYLKVAAMDGKNASSTSIPYKILVNVPAGGVKAEHWLANSISRIASKGLIDEEAKYDLNKNISRIEVARMLSKMWDLTTPMENVEIADMDKSNPEYNMVAAILEKNMMSLKDGKFDPTGTITRQEMASVAMMSCGVSYKNASTIYDSTFSDGDEIGATYLTNVERSKYFGFMVGTEIGTFSPKKNLTYAEAIAVMDRVSDFAGK